MENESCYCAATHAPCGWCTNPKNSHDSVVRFKFEMCYCDLLAPQCLPPCLVCINAEVNSKLAHEFELAQFSMSIANWFAENLTKLER